MNDEALDGYCGLWCGACEIVKAERNGTQDGIAGIFGVEPSEIHCRGCRSEDVFAGCSRCPMRACASTREVEFCSDCPDFPCGEYRRIASSDDSLPPHFRTTIRNLGEIREKGASEWRRLQAGRWACPSCGRPFSWYAEECSCGQDLRGRKDWEKL